MYGRLGMLQLNNQSYVVKFTDVTKTDYVRIHTLGLINILLRHSRAMQSNMN